MVSFVVYDSGTISIEGLLNWPVDHLYAGEYSGGT
jgi:hypothetical protein